MLHVKIKNVKIDCILLVCHEKVDVGRE